STTARRPVISLSRIVSSGGLGSAAGSFIGSGSPATTTRARGPVGDGSEVPGPPPCKRPMTLMDGGGVLGGWGARLYQHIGALSRRDQQLLHLLQGAQLDAVVGDDVEPVLVELQQHVVLVLRADQAPALHLPRPHVDGRPPLAVDRQEARR